MHLNKSPYASFHHINRKYATMITWLLRLYGLKPIHFIKVYLLEHQTICFQLFQPLFTENISKMDSVRTCGDYEEGESAATRSRPRRALATSDLCAACWNNVLSNWLIFQTHAAVIMTFYPIFLPLIFTVIKLDLRLTQEKVYKSFFTSGGLT